MKASLLAAHMPASLCFRALPRAAQLAHAARRAGGQRVAPPAAAARSAARRSEQQLTAQRPAAAAEQQQHKQLQPGALGAGADWLLAVLALWALVDAPAQAAEPLPGGPPASSYYVSLGLFLITLPGLWSLIKRAPKAKIRRRTYEVLGPAQPGAMPLDQRAQQIFQYFKTYNYEIKSTGEVITFEGQYRASTSQAAALVAYTLISLASTALVLSIAAPWGGNYWYLLCLLSPAAGAYYLAKADRTEQMRVKMVTADDDSVTDITLEGDEEELDRFAGELGMVEKGKVYVRGILER